MRRRKPERGRHRQNGRDDWIVVEDAHEALVPRKLWEQANERIARNRRPYADRRPRSPYLLAGLLYCGECGAKMTGDTKRKHYKDHVYTSRRYTCSRYVRGALKGHPCSIKAGAIEDFVIGKIQEQIAGCDLREAARKKLMAKRQALRAAAGDNGRGRIERRLREVEAALGRVNDRVLMVPDEMVEAVLDKAEALRAERGRLAAQLTEAESKAPQPPQDDLDAEVSRFLAAMQDVGRVLADGDMGAKKQVFQRFLAQPDGEPGPVTLYYSISQQDNGRYRGRLVRGALGIVPLAEGADGEDVSSHGKEWLPDEDSSYSALGAVVLDLQQKMIEWALRTDTDRAFQEQVGA